MLKNGFVSIFAAVLNYIAELKPIITCRHLIRSATTFLPDTLPSLFAAV
jgi:hypothetical protein